MTIVDAVASDWIVRSTLGLRDNYRAPVTDHRDFTCRVSVIVKVRFLDRCSS